MARRHRGDRLADRAEEKAPRAYRDVKVPEDLMEAVDALVDAGGLGYRNPGEFAVEAIRRRVEELSRRLGLDSSPPRHHEHEGERQKDTE